MFASSAAIPWYRLALQTPLTTLAIFVAGSLILKRDYSISHFPFSSPTAPRAYYMVTDSAGQPLPIAKLTGVTPPKIGKMHWRKSRQSQRETEKQKEERLAGTTKLAARFAPCCEIRLLAGGRFYRQAFNYFASRYDMMTGSSERQRSSFLPNSRTPFSRLLAGFFSPPKVTPLEGLLCASFSQSWWLTRFGLKFRFPRNRIRRGWPIFSISPGYRI